MSTIIERLEHTALRNESMSISYKNTSPETADAYSQHAQDLRDAIEAIKFKDRCQTSDFEELASLQAHCEYLNREIGFCMNILNDGTYPQIGEWGGFYGKLAAKANYDRDLYKKRAEHAEQVIDDAIALLKAAK